MRARWGGAPAAARACGHEGNHRLHRRWLAFTERRKKPVVATSPSPARSRAGADPWPSWTTDPQPSGRRARRVAARGTNPRLSHTAAQDLAAWHAALAHAGIPPVPLHSARHTTATLRME